MYKAIVLKQEYHFPPTIRFVGYLFLASSLFTLLNMPILGGLMVLVFSFVSFSKTTNRIDLEKRTINHKDLPRKNFPLDTYVNLSLLSASVSTSVYSRSNRKLTSSNKEFQIVLLNTKHTKRLVLEKYKDKESAQLRIEDLSNDLKMEISKYNPQIASRKGRR